MRAERWKLGQLRPIIRWLPTDIPGLVVAWIAGKGAGTGFPVAAGGTGDRLVPPVRAASTNGQSGGPITPPSRTTPPVGERCVYRHSIGALPARRVGDR